MYIYFMWCEIERYIYMQTLDLLRVQLNKVFCSFRNLVLKLQNVYSNKFGFPCAGRKNNTYKRAIIFDSLQPTHFPKIVQLLKPNTKYLQQQPFSY